MTQHITKKDLAEMFKNFGQQIDKKMQENTTEIVQHFNQSQSGQNERLSMIETKLDSIMDELATRKELRNLVGELKRQGVQIHEEKVFIT